MFENGENRAREVGTIVSSKATDHCFIDINMFKEYEKFETLLTGKMAEKRTSFRVVERNMVKIVIEIRKGNAIDLILQDILYTLGLYLNLIFIPKICRLKLDVVSRVNDVIVRFKDRRIVIWGKH